MAELKFGIYGDSTSFKKALDDATKGVTQAKNKIESEGKSMESVFGSLKNAAKGLGVAFGLNELKNLGVQIAKTRGDFQQLEVSFKTMLGSGEKANAMLKQLTTTAATTPFGLQEVAGGAKQLLAYGIEAEKVNDMLIRLGDIASGLSIPLNDLVYLYGTTMTQGRMFTQDLRQFQGRGIPIADELAKQFGIAKSQVGEFVTAGKVGAKEVEQAIINMTSAGSQFGGLMKAQSETIGGRWSNITDQIDMAFNEIGQNSEGVINSVLDSISYLVENYETIGKAIASVIAMYGAWKTALIAHNAIRKANQAGEIAYLEKIIQGNMEVMQSDMERLDAQIKNAEELGDADAYVELMTKKEALAKSMETSQEQLNTLAKTQNTTATQTNSASTATNTAATTTNTTAQVANTTATKAGTIAQRMFALATKGAKLAMDGLKMAFKTNPIGLIATALTSVISLIWTFTDSQEDMNKSLDEGKDKAKGYFDALKQEGDTIKGYVKTIQDKNADDLEQIKAYRELIALVPELTNQYTQQQLAAMDALQAERLLTEAMRERELVKSQKDIDIAQSTLKSLENGAVWDTLQAEQRKFMQDTMGYDRDADEDAMKNALKGFIPTAKNAHSALIQLNKVSDLKNMKSGAEKVNSLNVELQNVEARANLLEEFTNTLTKIGENANDSEARKKLLLDLSPQIKDQFGVNFDLKTLTDLIDTNFFSGLDQEETKKNVQQFLETYFDGVAEEYDAQKKMLEDEINKEKGIEVNPFAKMNKEQVEKEIEKITQEIADIERALAQNKELEQTIIVNTNIPTEKSEQAIKDAQAKLDANAKLLGQDKYVSANMQYNIAIDPQFQIGGQPVDPFSFDLSTYLKSISHLGKGTAQGNANAQKRQLNAQLAQAEKRKEQLTPEVTTPPNGNGKTKKELEAEYKEAQNKRIEVEKKVGAERVQDATDIENEITQATIDAKKEGSEKILAQMAHDRKLQQEELQKRKEDAIQAEKDRQKQLFEAQEAEKVKESATRKKKYIATAWDDSMLDQSKIDAIIAQYNKLAEAQENLTKAQSSMEVIKSRRGYLQEYGSSLAQELAITEDYAEKIASARAKGNEYEALSLERERDAKIDESQTKQLVANIDWVTALGGNFSTAFKGALEPTLNQLRAYSKTDAFAKLETTNQQAVVDAINRIEGVIGTGGLGWKDLSQAILDFKNAQAELVKAIQDQSNAQLALDTALANQANATTDEQREKANKEVENAQMNFVKSSNAVAIANKKVSATQKNLSSTSQAVIEPMDSIGTFLKGSGLSQLESLWSAFQKLKGALDGLKALKDVKDAVDNTKGAIDGISNVANEIGDKSKNVADASGTIGEKAQSLSDKTSDISEKGGKLADKLGEIGESLESAGFIGQIVSAVLSIFDILKDGVGSLIGSILDSALSAVNGILDNILSGQFIEDIFGTLANGIWDIIKTLGNTLTLGLLEDWWFYDDKALQDKLDRLSESNDALRYAIGELKTTIEEASFGDAIDAYEQALEDNRKSEENTRKQMQLAGSDSTSGFLGINSKGSSFREVTKNIGADEWDRVSDIVGFSVDSASDFFNLTSEQMHEVATRAPEVWANIKYHASQGYKDASIYMDDYIELWKDADELTDQLIEKLTALSFDDLSGKFGDFIADSEAQLADFGNTFEEIMANAIKESMMSGYLGEEIKKFQKKWAEMTESGGGLDATEVAQLRQEWNDIATNGKNAYEEQLRLMGIDQDKLASSSSASGRGIESMTQAEAEELNGRFTALQIAGEGIRQQTAQTNALISALTAQIAPSIATSAESSNTLYELRELAISRNAYLSDISDYTKNLIAIKKTLSNIETNTQNL